MMNIVPCSLLTLPVTFRKNLLSMLTDLCNMQDDQFLQSAVKDPNTMLRKTQNEINV